jgi:hypothetical protein
VLGELVKDEVFDAGPPVGLAEAVNAGVGFDADEIPVPGAADDHAFDGGDFDLAFMGRGEGVEREGAEGADGGRAGDGFEEVTTGGHG